MQDTLPFFSHTTTSPFPSHHHHHFPSLPRPKNLAFPILSFKPNTIVLPPTPPSKTPQIPSQSPAPPTTISPPRADFQEKMLFLDSIGIDFLTLIKKEPHIISTPISEIKSTIDYMTATVGFTTQDLRRIISMCPSLLTSPLSTRIIPIITFLLREAHVDGTTNLRRAIARRPRLLACSVEKQLRPALYFLQSIGITQPCKHTYLLSCSVENKLIPKINYFCQIGFSRKESLSMFRRFPALFNYSVGGNLKPKFNYFVVEMGRDLAEIKEFPQYFSFSLENRIKPRHQCCVEKGVRFPLPVLLKAGEAEFRDRLEVCCGSSMPLKTSPLYCTKDLEFY